MRIYEFAQPHQTNADPAAQGSPLGSGKAKIKSAVKHITVTDLQEEQLDEASWKQHAAALAMSVASMLPGNAASQEDKIVYPSENGAYAVIVKQDKVLIARFNLLNNSFMGYVKQDNSPEVVNALKNRKSNFELEWKDDMGMTKKAKFIVASI